MIFDLLHALLLLVNKLEGIRTECSVVWLFNSFNYPVRLSSAKMMDFQFIGDWFVLWVRVWTIEIDRVEPPQKKSWIRPCGNGLMHLPDANPVVKWLWIIISS